MLAGHVGRRLCPRRRAARLAHREALLTDWLDWLDGYPFEVASPEAIVDFHVRRGFALTKLRTVGWGHGNNEFVFRKTSSLQAMGVGARLSSMSS